MKIVDGVRALWDEKRYVKLGLVLLLLIAAAVVTLSLIVSTLVAVKNFVVQNQTLVFITTFALVTFFGWIYDRAEQRRKLQSQAEQQAREEAQFMEESLAQNNYDIVRQCLFNVLSDVADTISLIKPDRLSQLDSPAKYAKKGNVLFYQYLILKKEAVIDPHAVKQVLQTRISQRLQAQEFAGITETSHYYKGQMYPLLYLDEVIDVGNYIQVDITWVSDTYCEYLRNKTLFRHECGQAPAQPRDTDF